MILVVVVARVIRFDWIFMDRTREKDLVVLALLAGSPDGAGGVLGTLYGKSPAKSLEMPNESISKKVNKK